MSRVPDRIPPGQSSSRTRQARRRRQVADRVAPRSRDRPRRRLGL